MRHAGAFLMLLLAPSLRAAPPERFTPVPLIIAPVHSEELFSDDGGWGVGPIPVGRGDVVVMAAELERREIQAARFQISSDGGLRFRTFAADREDESAETGNNPEPETQHLFDGVLGWSAVLDTRELAEGVHLLRVEMISHGRRGTDTVAVRVMDSPPLIAIDLPDEPVQSDAASDPMGPGQIDARLYPVFLSGVADIPVVPADAGDMVLDLLEGSPPLKMQEGQGTLDQDDLGPPSSNLEPGGAPLNMWCAPTAAANALWPLATIDPRMKRATMAGGAPWLPFIRKCQEDIKAKHPVKDPSDLGDYGANVEAFYASKPDSDYVSGDELTLEGLAMILACKMKTDPVDGTAQANIGAGVPDFLKEQGNDADYTPTAWDGAKEGNAVAGLPPHPAKRKLLPEIAKDEAVVIAISRIDGSDGHLVTGTGYADAPAPGTITIRDPRTGATSTASVGTDSLGNTTLILNGVHRLIQDIWAWSPTDAARASFALDAFRRVGAVAAGGMISWNTSEAHDGVHVLRATACTPQRACGSRAAQVYVNNLPPLPLVSVVASPGVATFTICDQAGSEDIVGFQGAVGPSPFVGGPIPSGCSVQAVPVPPGNHPWIVQLRDLAGAFGAANGFVNVP